MCGISNGIRIYEQYAVAAIGSIRVTSEHSSIQSNHCAKKIIIQLLKRLIKLLLD